MLPSLIATDLDGTLLDRHGDLSSHNVAMLRAARHLGIPLVIATGRPPRWLDALRPIRDLEPLVICSNGALQWDLARGVEVCRDALDQFVAADVVTVLRAEHPSISFAVEYGLGWACEPEVAARRGSPTPDRIADVCDLLDESFVKLLALCADTGTENLGRIVRDAVGKRLEVTWSGVSERAGLVELGPSGVTKGSALSAICQRLGVDITKAVGFGDMPNDMPMLTRVGSPHAMKHCHPDLALAGFPTAGDHDDSGVGRTLERLLNDAQ